MEEGVGLVDPAKNRLLIKTEIDAADIEVMSMGDLIDRDQFRSFEENMTWFVGAKYAVSFDKETGTSTRPRDDRMP
jgi:hypothetical protein